MENWQLVALNIVAVIAGTFVGINVLPFIKRQFIRQPTFVDDVIASIKSDMNKPSVSWKLSPRGIAKVNGTTVSIAVTKGTMGGRMLDQYFVYADGILCNDGLTKKELKRIVKEAVKLQAKLQREVLRKKTAMESIDSLVYKPPQREGISFSMEG